MRWKLLALLLLVVLPLAVAYDISTYISQESAYLEEGESIEQPTAQITHNGEKYWVVPVIQNDAVVTYLPLLANEKAVERNTPTNRKLFKTADILRSYLLNKQNIISNPGADFLITSANSRTAGTLSRFIADEIFEMNIIQVEVTDAAIRQEVDTLKGRLVTLSEETSQLSGQLDDALAAENAFIQAPDTNSADEMKGEFDHVYDLLFGLEEEALDYRSEVDQLKQHISLSSLDATTKNTLISYAGLPEGFEMIGSWSQDAAGLQQITDSIYANAGIKVDGYLAEFETRVKRNNAYQVLYGVDNTFLEKTDNQFTSIAQAAGEMLSRDNKPLWKNQDKVEELENNWGEAVRFFDRKEYETAEHFAQLAKDNAVAVLRDGVREPEVPDLFSPELILQIVGVLVVLLVGLYIIQNRKRVMEMISPGSRESEEIDTSRWEKEL